ncbi:MAG: thioredoxin family protein [Candidatus Pseudothioglobus sp.]
MVRTETPICEFDLPAINFKLKGVDEQFYDLKSLKGPNGLLIMFICNHCPYVKSIISRIIRDTKELKHLGVNSVGIMSNDPNEYEEDSFENMKKMALDHDFPFPYLIDDTQEVARAYGAVCTPDFFGYNRKLGLQYRGRLDESRKESVDGARRELFEAMKEISMTGKGPKNQIPSMGCSIKWFK